LRRRQEREKKPAGGLRQWRSKKWVRKEKSRRRKKKRPTFTIHDLSQRIPQNQLDKKKERRFVHSEARGGELGSGGETAREGKGIVPVTGCGSVRRLGDVFIKEGKSCG